MRAGGEQEGEGLRRETFGPSIPGPKLGLQSHGCTWYENVTEWMASSDPWCATADRGSWWEAERDTWDQGMKQRHDKGCALGQRNL